MHRGVSRALGALNSQTNMKRSTLICIALSIAVCLVIGLCVFRFGGVPSLSRVRTSHPRVPTRLLPQDFQTVEDARLMVLLRKAENTSAMKVLDEHVIKPVFDDVKTRRLTLECVEVTADQFSDLHSTVIVCSRILHLQKPPRVFVSNFTESSTLTENYSEPVIVLHASVLDRFRDPAERRFLVGRELGHVKAGHTRCNTLVRRMKSLADRLSVFGNVDSCSPLLPVLQWARQSEMTADNAGLICAQDQQTAERVLMRLATGVDDPAGTPPNVNAYMRQGDEARLSGLSEFALLWREWNRPVPFGPHRIRQLRDYYDSIRYTSLWK
jgi:Zn-dependent protease with chaperone function